MASAVTGFPVSSAPGSFGSPPVGTPIGWYDASDLSTLTLAAAGGRVTAWADKSASALDAAEETSAEPAASVTIPETHDGRAVLLGRDQFAFSVAGLSGQDRTQTVFWVGCIFDFSSARTLIGASANNGRLFRVETTGRLACLKRNVSTLATASAAMTVTAGTAFAAGLILDASTIDFRFNNAAQETFSESTTFASATGSFIGGGDTSALQRPPGYVCEAVFFDGAMSSGDADTMMAWLMSKWNIA